MAKGKRENLMPTSERSKEEARELGKKGGQASGAARRRKKNMRQTLEVLLSLQAKHPGAVKAIAEAGGDGDTNMDAVVAVLFSKALEGDTGAIRDIRDLIGEKPVEKQETVNDNKITFVFDHVEQGDDLSG